MATIFFKPMRMPPTAAPVSPKKVPSPAIDTNDRCSVVDKTPPPPSTPSRTSILRGFSRGRSMSSPSAGNSLTDDEDDDVPEFEIDIDTPVSMCMNWKEMLKTDDTTSNASDAAAKADEAVAPPKEEFRHTYAKANAMKLRVNPKNGLLGFRKTTSRRAHPDYISTLAQTLEDSAAYVLPTTAFVDPPSATMSLPAKFIVPPSATMSLPLTSSSAKPRDLFKPASWCKQRSDVSPSRSKSNSPERPQSPPPPMTTTPVKTPKPLVSVLKVKIDPPKSASATPAPPAPPLPPVDADADIDIDQDDSIFSSLRNVDLVSSHAPESTRVREQQKAAVHVNKNVVAFLGGFKSASGGAHRVKVSGDILNRAKNIRKRTAEGQLSRKLKDARNRIPAEFRDIDGNLPRKIGSKKLRFPDEKSRLELIYVFDVIESDDDEDAAADDADDGRRGRE
ncbi:Aste57867_25486 [Aphanomyces stellatus]|uniref:Aste57867_25486 protein n=1 Tax=Aphanomyces stellatus TaxID=120398 RepID=A0A485LTF3_9STRA|nr:hypothetical protein As57867_025407 [Aphanomyces stellatus]VFU02109.1 Aste57867_25486 [Aphanomyces stellatus]